MQKDQTKYHAYLRSYFVLFIVRNEVPVYRQFIKQGLLYTKQPVEFIDSFSDVYRFDIFDYARVPDVTQKFQPI